MNRGNWKHNCKVVLVGEASVGKSSLVMRFVKNKFVPHFETTVGAAFFMKTLPLDDYVVKFEIWDTAGQEKFHCLVPMYYRGAKAAIIVYDITKHDSFVKAQKWVRSLRQKADPHLITFLVGNKADLEKNREVEKQKAESYAKKENLRFFETSAKFNYNIEEIFREIGKKYSRIPKPIDTNEEFPSISPTKTSCC